MTDREVLERAIAEGHIPTLFHAAIRNVLAENAQLKATCLADDHEIERLRELCQQNSDDLTFLDQVRAENERLKAEVLRVQAEVLAENERLKAEVLRVQAKKNQALKGVVK